MHKTKDMEEGVPTYRKELFMFSKDPLVKFYTFHTNELKRRCDNAYSYLASKFRITERVYM
jgi:hypothetical protein